MLKQFLLYCRITRRTFEMLPRRKKSIRLLQLDSQPVAGHDGHILMKYKFTNAIYYTIGGHKLMESQVIMKQPEEGQTVLFTVYGFSKQNDYTLSMVSGQIILTRIVQKPRVAETSRATQPSYNISLVHS
ncbi:MAG: hypothetical protein ACO1N9_13445 [Flavobacterium sp.]